MNNKDVKWVHCGGGYHRGFSKTKQNSNNKPRQALFGGKKSLVRSFSVVSDRLFSQKELLLR
jgi:hypothetical protein